MHISDVEVIEALNQTGRQPTPKYPYADSQYTVHFEAELKRRNRRCYDNVFLSRGEIAILLMYILCHSGQRIIMGFIIKIVIVSVVLLAFTLNTSTVINAQDHNSHSMGVDGAAALPVIPSTEMVPVDTTENSTKAKNSKKRATKNKSIVETNPGKKVSINQVMDILKTTRDLSGKNLSGLQLIGVNMTKCNLKGVDLSHANLERADLGESNLERADLTGTNLKMANLRLSGMTGTNLERAILDGAVWKDGMVCATGSIGECREFQSR